MNEELITVIVPVYNVEKYLDRCIKSILRQTYRYYEVLLIDDGSTDQSGKLCDRYASEYECIATFHKVNGGLGSARNYGIARSKGKYICFADSDDEIEADYLACLHDAICDNDADISISGYYYSEGKHIATYSSENKVIGAEQLLDEFAKGKSLLYFAWNKLYKKEIIDTMPQLFVDRHCAEDMHFNSIYYRYVNTIALIQNPLYKYYVNLESLSNGRRSHFWQDMLSVYDEFLKTCKEKNAIEKEKDLLFVILLRNSISNYFNYKTSLREYSEYLDKCLSIKTIDMNQINTQGLSTLDRIIFWSISKRWDKLTFLLICLMKWIKRKHFRFFCFLRKGH